MNVSCVNTRSLEEGYLHRPWVTDEVSRGEVWRHGGHPSGSLVTKGFNLVAPGSHPGKRELGQVTTKPRALGSTRPESQTLGTPEGALGSVQNAA